MYTLLYTILNALLLVTYVEKTQHIFYSLNFSNEYKFMSIIRYTVIAISTITIQILQYHYISIL